MVRARMCRSPLLEGEPICRDSGTQRDDRLLRRTALKPSVGSLWMGESTKESSGVPGVSCASAPTTPAPEFACSGCCRRSAAAGHRGLALAAPPHERGQPQAQPTGWVHARRTAASWRICSRCLRTSGLSPTPLSAREAQLKADRLQCRARHFDGATMKLHDGLHDGESQTV